MYNNLWADERQIAKSLREKLDFKKRVFWKDQKSILHGYFKGLKFLQLLSFDLIENEFKLKFVGFLATSATITHNKFFLELCDHNIYAYLHFKWRDN